jgi:SNF2 family DNA or RNA helicase
MTTPVLSIGLKDGGPVLIRRRPDVSDDVWFQVRAFWSADGRDATSTVSVPVETFMAQRGAFATRCKALGVGVDLDAHIITLAKQAKESRRRLDDALGGEAAVEPAEVEHLLGASRITRQMRPFQTRDMQKLIALENGANFSVPGAGKTAVTLGVYEAERVRGRVKRLLVIAPLSAFGSWFDEVKAWLDPAPDVYRYLGGKVPKGAEIVIVNYQRLESGYDHLAEWVSAEPTMVVLDEAHRMKRGWQGEWGSACLSLAYRAARRDILTGTPAPQHPRDLIALIDFLWPNQAIRILPPDGLVSRPANDAMPRVAAAIRPLFARTTKGDLQLPEVTTRAIRLPMADLHAQIYAALRDEYKGQNLGFRDRIDFIRMGRVVMYLLEAATNPKLLTAGSLDGSDPEIFRHPPLEIPPGSRLADLLARYNEHETPRKFVELAKILTANAEQGRKTLVWSNFVRNLKILERMLARYQPALIHGGVPTFSPNPTDRTRETEIARFRKDPECLVLLANPAAMSEGISLHMECHDAVYLDRTFNAGQYLQSIDRIHRLGLPEGQETRVTFLLSDGTIDEVVDDRVLVKAERLGVMLDDPNLAPVALPNEEDYGPAIEDDADDLAALFAHLRGDDAH